MISILDYGVGNVRAFKNIYRRLGVPCRLVTNADELSSASKLILPGVGAFDWALTRLHESGMTKKLNYLVLEKKIPVLGVCVGMQMMANESEEGTLPGLGWIAAKVERFHDGMFNQQTHLPHMGWNHVVIYDDDKLFRNIVSPKYYFLHSYYLKASDTASVIGSSIYGIEFASAIAKDNIYATQFHPEKSHDWGVKLLQNFASYC